MGKLLLVVDDSVTIRTAVEMVFHGTEYEVVSKGSGSDGLSFIAEQTPDIILVDERMPDMDGYDFGTAVKKEDKNEEVPILLLACHDGPDDSRADDADLDGYVNKPFGAQELVTLVEMLTGSNLSSAMPMSFKDQIAHRKNQQAQSKPSESTDIAPEEDEQKALEEELLAIGTDEPVEDSIDISASDDVPVTVDKPASSPAGFPMETPPPPAAVPEPTPPPPAPAFDPPPAGFPTDDRTVESPAPAMEPFPPIEAPAGTFDSPKPPSTPGLSADLLIEPPTEAPPAAPTPPPPDPAPPPKAPVSDLGMSPPIGEVADTKDVDEEPEEAPEPVVPASSPGVNEPVESGQAVDPAESPRPISTQSTPPTIQKSGSGGVFLFLLLLAIVGGGIAYFLVQQPQ